MTGRRNSKDLRLWLADRATGKTDIIGQPELKAAKRAEIDRRYKAKQRAGWQRMSFVKQITAVKRGQLKRLLSSRRDNRSIEEVAGVDWHLQKPREISDRLNITLREKMELNLRNLPACDVTPEEEAAAMKARRNAMAAARKRDKRKAMQIRKQEMEIMISDLSIREEIVHVLLKASRKWTTVKQMTRKVKNAAAFRCPDGSPMSAQSFKMIIHRAYDALSQDGLIEQKREQTKRGIPVRFARWKADPNDRNTVTTEQHPVRARATPHGMGTTSISGSRLRTRPRTSFIHETTLPAERLKKGVAERRRSSSPSLLPPLGRGRGTVH
jgi:hypothetical protein